MSENIRRYTVTIEVAIDLDAWRQEYHVDEQTAHDDAQRDLREYASTYYMEPKWEGLVTDTSVSVQELEE